MENHNFEQVCKLSLNGPCSTAMLGYLRVNAGTYSMYIYIYTCLYIYIYTTIYTYKHWRFIPVIYSLQGGTEDVLEQVGWGAE